MTTILLIRHGETAWNRTGRWQGHSDIPLSDEGREQSRALAARLAAERARINHIYASDLLRAYETAQIIAESLRMSVRALPELREIDIGPWSGLTRAQIIERFPGAFVQFDLPPGAEPHESFSRRVSHALERLAAQHPDERLAVVTHGGVVRAMIDYLQSLDGKSLPVPHIGNTSITELQQADGRWRLVRSNDLTHLSSPQAPDMLAPEPINEGDTAV